MTERSSLLRHLTRCSEHDFSRFVPFRIGKRTLGCMRRDYLAQVKDLPGFAFKNDALSLTAKTPKARTEALIRAAEKLSKFHKVPLVGEIYPVLETWGEEALAEIDRAAIPWFGVRGFGVHVNGYVRKNGEILMWIAQRALDRRIDPGKLDNIIAGGLPIGLTVEENLAKEAKEEAGLSPELALTATPHGLLSYKLDMMKGVRNDALFVYDLDLPESYEPKNTDGEVDHFELRPAQEVLKIVRETDDFKFNCNLVIIDFAMRHGLIQATEPGYASLAVGLDIMRG